MRCAVVCIIAVGGCAVFNPAPPRTIVRVDTVIVTKTVAPVLPMGDSALICLATGMPISVLIAPTGDTLIGEARIRLRDVRPPLTFAGTYAGQAAWFANDTLRFDKRLYRKSGGTVRRVCDDLKEVGLFNGVPVFADVTAMGNLPIIMVPVRPGMFQSYSSAAAPRRRR